MFNYFQYYEMSYGLNVEMHKQVKYKVLLKWENVIKYPLKTRKICKCLKSFKMLEIDVIYSVLSTLACAKTDQILN